MKKYIAEAVGTFALVFAGTGAIVVNDLTNGAISHLGVAFTFGLVVMAMVHAIGDVSGAHINPAVSLGFWIAKKMSGPECLAYMISQVIGALLASLLMWYIFPGHPTLGTTEPAFGNITAFIFEIILTFFLMFVIISVASGPKEKGFVAGVAIGNTIALDALFGGPVSGASMNPARSLAPALISGRLDPLWIYLTAPFIGACVAVMIWQLVGQPRGNHL